MANVLLCRLRQILQTHFKKLTNLSDVYTNFEFLIFTAKFNSLRNQTLKRLLHPDAGIVPLSLAGKDRERYGEERILKYQLADKEEKLVEKFRKNVEEADKNESDSGRTLFLVVADESHWGTVKDKETEGKNPQEKKTQKAFHKFVNTWSQHKDVVVLQVSATPFNLLTTNSRIPQVYYQDQGSKTEKERHVVHWAELALEQFRKGCAVRLSTINGECCVGVLDGEVVASSSSKSLIFIDGSQSSSGQIVRLFEYDYKTGAIGRIFGLTSGATSRGKSHSDLIAVARENIDSMSKHCFDFEAVLDSGMGIVSLRAASTASGIYLKAEKNVESGIYKISQASGVEQLSVHRVRKLPRNCAFQFDVVGIQEEEAGGQMVDIPKRYLSLNYYMNSIMREDAKKRLIKNDERFAKVLRKLGKLPYFKTKEADLDVVLAWEYAFLLLWLFSEKTEMVLETSLIRARDSFANFLDKFKQELSGEEEASAFEEFCKTFAVEAGDTLFSHLFNIRKETMTKQLESGLDIFCESVFLSSVHHDSTKTKVVHHHYERPDLFNHVLFCIPTLSILHELILQKPSIKIARVKSKKMGEKTASIIRSALSLVKDSAVGGKFQSFFVICDFGSREINAEVKYSFGVDEFKRQSQLGSCKAQGDCSCSCFTPVVKDALECELCKHQHRHFRTYMDLESFPCLLILVKKARMGDTFPHTLNCMDLRLFHTETATVTITQMMQELGRLCRYVDRSEAVNEPFAIVGQKLYKKLKNHFNTCASFTAIKMNPDTKMIKTKDKKNWDEEKPDLPFRVRWLGYEAGPTSCDHEHEPKRVPENRLLLQAEPQIGKTGTYLRFIEELRSKICRDEDSELINCGDFDNEAKMDEKESEGQAVFHEKDWIYPHHVNFNWEKARRLDYELSQSKYEPLLHYTPREKRSELVKKILNKFNPRKIGRDTPDVNPRGRRNNFVVEWEEETNHVKSYSEYHASRNCFVCLPARKESHFDVTTKSLKLDALKIFEINEVLISVPGGSSFKSFRVFLQNDNLQALCDFKWVFIPTYNRARRALLNFSHLIERGSTFIPLFALVVRESEFQAYQNIWGRFHVIVQLPRRFLLPLALRKQLDYSFDYVTDDINRIGFSRLFMQLFAHALGLSFAFHMDDNVSSLYCVDFADINGPQIKMKKTYLTTILSHLWNQFDPRAELPEELQTSLCTRVVDYSGQPDKYGVLGMKFDRLGYRRPPFRHGRLGALYLLNVKATVEKDVFFMPAPFLADVMFCDDCDAKQLLCCKYGRFVFVKALIEGSIKYPSSDVKQSTEQKREERKEDTKDLREVKREDVREELEVNKEELQEDSGELEQNFKKFGDSSARADTSRMALLPLSVDPFTELKQEKISDALILPSPKSEMSAVSSGSIREAELPLFECRCSPNSTLSLKELLYQHLEYLKCEYVVFPPCYEKDMVKPMSSENLRTVKDAFKKFSVEQKNSSEEPSDLFLLLSFVDNKIVTKWPDSVGLFLQLDLERIIGQRGSTIDFAWAMPIGLASTLNLTTKKRIIKFLRKCDIRVSQCDVYWTCVHEPESPYSVVVVIFSSEGDFTKNPERKRSFLSLQEDERASHHQKKIIKIEID